MLGRRWEPAKGKIVERKAMKLGGGPNHNQFEFVVDIEIEGRSAFRAKMKSPTRMPDRFVAPSAGEVVSVLADAERKRAKWDRSPVAGVAGAGGLPLRREIVLEDGSRIVLEGGSGTERDLQSLAKLKEQGAITDALYERVRKDIEKG
jgi:hypothetical protein